MASDDESKDSTGKLTSREEYPGWKSRVQMLALAKGDVNGIFGDDGSDANVGYQAIPGNAAARAPAQKEWNQLARKLVGKVASTITNESLLRIWTQTYSQASAAPAAGQDDQRPYVFALCMKAIEQECYRVGETANLIARGEFVLALKSFVDKQQTGAKGESSSGNTGFIAYVDKIRRAEEKLRSYGVNMSDQEKKQLFYTHFSSKTDDWSTLMTVWQQQTDLTFDGILAKGLTEQQRLDLKKTEAESSNVRAYAAMNNGYDDDHDTYRKRRRSGGRGGGGSDSSAYGGFPYRKGGKGKGRGGKGGGRAGGRGGKGKGGGLGKGGGFGKFQGECWTCGQTGHRSEDCSWNTKGKGHGGKGGKNGKGKGRYVVPGCMAMINTPNCTSFDTPCFTLFEVAVIVVCVVCFASLCFMVRHVEYTVKTWITMGLGSSVAVMVAPIVKVGSSKVHNEFDDDEGRFTIKVNSVLSKCSIESKSKAIFDTGAAMHIPNSRRHMCDVVADNSYSVVGVGGKDKKTSCSYTGHIDMTFRGESWDTGHECLVEMKGDSGAESNALLCYESPLNLISYEELGKAGWLCTPDLSGIYHPKYRVSVWFERADGLRYMPLVDNGGDGEEEEESDGVRGYVGSLAVSSFLSTMTRWFVTFGGPDITRLRKTGEITGLKLEGNAPPPIREFTMAKMRRSYPSPEKEITVYKPFECVVWDMVGPFRTTSIGGSRYSHDGVDRAMNLRFVYPVTDASAETFVEVMQQFIVFVGQVPGEFVFKIMRADHGSNYTSKHVRKFLQRNGIRMQLSAVATPHMIRRGELNHAILNATMRAIMSFANAPRNTWALARKWAAVLNNFLATKYNTPDAFVPWYSVEGVTMDVDAMLPFGCLVVVHKAKEQVQDGYCDQRGEAGAFVGWAYQEGVKAVSVLLPGDKLVHTVFYKADVAYFPWRPDGQRRLLDDGTFGGERETARVFSHVPETVDFGELLDAFKGDDDVEGAVEGVEGVAENAGEAAGVAEGGGVGEVEPAERDKPGHRPGGAEFCMCGAEK